MEKTIKNLENEIEDYFYEFDSHVLTVSDFDIRTSQNVPITHITQHSSVPNATIGLWCGDPENDKHAEELIVSDEERIRIYKELQEYLY